MSDKRYVKSICDTLITKRFGSKLTYLDEDIKDFIYKIPTPSGENIVIFLKKAEKPLPGNPILLYAHGDGMSLKECDLSNYFCPYGMSFCVLDYRGNGYSDGEINTAAVNESEDCITVVNYLISQGFEKVSFFGHSLGAACGIYVASHFPNLVSIAIDSPYIDHEDRSAFKISKRYNITKEKVKNLYPESCKIIKDEYGIDFLSIEQLFDAATKITQPIFVVHGRKDVVLPFSHSERLMQLVKSEEKIFEPMNCGHCDFGRYDYNLRQFIFIMQHNGSNITKYEDND